MKGGKEGLRYNSSLEVGEAGCERCVLRGL